MYRSRDQADYWMPVNITDKTFKRRYYKNIFNNEKSSYFDHLSRKAYPCKTFQSFTVDNSNIIT